MPTKALSVETYSSNEVLPSVKALEAYMFTTTISTIVTVVPTLSIRFEMGNGFQQLS